MNKTNLNSILSDIAENARPAAQIDLMPGLKKSLATSGGRSGLGKPAMQRSPVLRRAGFAGLTALLALAIFLVTPQGQAFAQALLKYLTTVTQSSIPPVATLLAVPTYPLKAGLVPQPTISPNSEGCGGTISPISSTFICQLQDAQAKLGFAVKSFPAQYVQAPFVFMWIDQAHALLQMDFRDGQTGYHLDQGLGDFPTDCRGCTIYQDAVQPVQVGVYPAEYAAGAFIFPKGQVDQAMVWNADEPTYHLRWKENDQWYSFTMVMNQLGGQEPGEMKGKMVQIAENLAGLDQGADLLTAGNQPSIKDSASFTIKEPGLLPEGFRQVPDVTSSGLTTAPRVGMSYEYVVNGQWVNYLTLEQMIIPADDNTLRREYALLYQGQSVDKNGLWVNPDTDEAVQINGATGYYLDGGSSLTSALYWQDGEREYLLIYQWAPDFGGRLDKQTLIAIAESLR